MAKWTHDTVLDAIGTYIDANVSAMHVCAGQPTDRADAIARSLATVALAATDIALANGDVSGRKFTVAEKTGLTIDTGGTADHIAIISASILLVVTTCTSQALVQGGTVDVPAWDGETLDPT